MISTIQTANDRHVRREAHISFQIQWNASGSQIGGDVAQKALCDGKTIDGNSRTAATTKLDEVSSGQDVTTRVGIATEHYFLRLGRQNNLRVSVDMMTFPAVAAIAVHIQRA